MRRISRTGLSGASIRGQRSSPQFPSHSVSRSRSRCDRLGSPCQSRSGFVLNHLTMTSADYHSARLLFRRVTTDEALALVQEHVRIDGPSAQGYPDEGTRFFALRMLERDPGDADVFAMYRVAEKATGAVTGHIGFHGAPDRNGAVRIGYAIASGARRQGYAGEALEWILGLARAHPGVQAVLAETKAHNVASVRVLESHGFEVVRRDAEDVFYEATVAKDTAADAEPSWSAAQRGPQKGNAPPVARRERSSVRIHGRAR
jgi:RimJ/RimL family protein N-acetyltransferase